MKPNRLLFIPAVLAALVSLAFVLYALFGSIHPDTLQSGVAAGMRRDAEGGDGLFRTLGTIAVWCGAVGYAWLRLKKKRKSPSPVVKKLGKLFNRLHQPAGYAALAFVAAHGSYFLTQAAMKDDTFTGIAAFTLLLSLAVYGYLIRRVKLKHVRRIHFLLATAFAIVAIVHVGGSAILATLAVIVCWALIGLIERRAARPVRDGRQ
ncbi:hypothetical protein SAMN02799624_04220 [Paenibacillus sp. UNC496MF]|uniref:hypothetical protein n=1 Tax=Paenibacillus sp. UNC496MF TaxID=1502753 RepID=UPI0008E11473|nr:hypothetical protein [Paenibacillus sp. UNC496MF]SFJ35371.1 hypothetical protein SAMN02799624_04220 [Paenibacillus sp. UNC496MF]